MGGDTNRIQVLLNETKAKSLQFLKIVWQFLWTVKPVTIFIAQNPFIADANYFLSTIMSTLINLAQYEKFTEVIDNPSVQKIAMKCMQILCVFAEEEDFKEFYAKNGYKLFVQIVIPYLKVTEDEMDKISSDPKEFVQLIDDVCGD